MKYSSARVMPVLGLLLLLVGGCDLVARYAPGLAGYALAPPFEPLHENELTPGSKAPAGSFLEGKNGPRRVVKALEGHEDHVTQIAFLPDGQQLISASYGDFTLRLWDTREGRELYKFQNKTRPVGMALTPDGNTLIATDVAGAITFWPVEGDRLGEPHTIDAGIGHIGSIAVSPNGQLFATASFDKRVLIGNLQDRMLVRRIDTPEPMRGVAFSPEGDVLASGSNTNTITLWRLREGKGRIFTVSKVDPKSDVGSVAFSPDGNHLATGHMDSSLTIWDARKEKERHNTFVRNASTWSIAFTADSKFLATAQQDGGVYLWDVETGKHRLSLKQHSGAVRCLAFSPDGTMLATGGEDKKILIWE